MGSDQKRALLAVVLSGIILFGWQYFFAPKVQPTVNTTNNKEKVVHVTKTDSAKVSETNNSTGNTVVDTKLTTFRLERLDYSYELSSKLEVLNAKSHNSKLFYKDIFKEKSNALEFDFGSGYKAVNFSINKINESTAELTSNEGLKGKIELLENGRLNFYVSSSNDFRYRFNFFQKEEDLSGGKLKQFVLLSDDLETISVGSDDRGDQEALWFGLDFEYHLYAVILDGKKPLLYDAKEDGNFSVNYSKKVKQLNFDTIFIKKEYDNLAKLGDNLHLAVDFGMWSILATPILRGLQYFYSVIPNYGIAIIILTLIMRLLTFPLQIKSYRSMKKMQDVQPELAKIKEKYKNDPQRMQQETMALFKKAGANPLGGCLPMLLQMPIFFAFYRVLYNAVELVDAPFYFWITDLSAKDPYYVLPVLMALAMFFHQKLTPTTSMDPTQKKIMLFMPLIFAVFMKDFPAGLTLYIFISTVAGMAQQVFVYKKN